MGLNPVPLGLPGEELTVALWELSLLPPAPDCIRVASWSVVSVVRMTRCRSIQGPMLPAFAADQDPGVVRSGVVHVYVRR